MRPSNGELSKVVAGAVLEEVFVVLSQLGVTLGTSGMRVLIERVEEKLKRMHEQKRQDGRAAE